MLRRPSSKPLDVIPVILLLIGLLLIAVVLSLFDDRDPWTLAAVVMIAIGTLNGVILWIVYQRQRAAREQAIADVRLMLQDQLKNQLSIILTSTYLVTRSHDSTTYVNRINGIVEDISTNLDNLSEESLQAWQRRYNVTDVQHLSERSTSTTARQSF